MNDLDVSKQIQQMVRFIRQEAEEKANEISVSAEEEFNIEKLQLVEAEKKKIRQDYEKKEKQADVRKKIDYSMQLNASRIKVLQAQDDIVNAMKDQAAKDLLNVSGDEDAYKQLLKDLIVQCLLRLKEPSVLLRCREEDLGLVESILEDAKEEYAGKANVHAPEVAVDTTIFLPPPPTSSDPHGLHCSGGVVLASRDGKIVCENTLDARLDVAFRMKLPVIKAWLADKYAESLSRQAELLERKKRKKLRQKEQRVKDQTKDAKEDESTTSEEQQQSPAESSSVLSVASDSEAKTSDSIPTEDSSSLEEPQVLEIDNERNGETQAPMVDDDGFGNGQNMERRSGLREMERSKYGMLNGFHGWKEANSAEHVTLVLSQETDMPGNNTHESTNGVITAGRPKHRTKPEKGTKVKSG